jgi:hypothetical protein
MWQSIKETDFFDRPGVNCFLQFSALVFFTSQSFARCYHPRASPVISPEDWEDPSNPLLSSSNEFQFFRTHGFFSPVLLLKNEMECSGNQRKRISVLRFF